MNLVHFLIYYLFTINLRLPSDTWLGHPSGLFVSKLKQNCMLYLFHASVSVYVLFGCQSLMKLCGSVYRTSGHEAVTYLRHFHVCRVENTEKWHMFQYYVVNCLWSSWANKIPAACNDVTKCGTITFFGKDARRLLSSYIALKTSHLWIFIKFSSVIFFRTLLVVL
jgi:hypothetical protein